MLILFLTVSSLYIYLPQGYYQIHTITQDPVDCLKKIIIKYSRAYQDLVSDEVSHSYERTTSYPTETVFYFRIDNHVDRLNDSSIDR